MTGVQVSHEVGLGALMRWTAGDHPVWGVVTAVGERAKSVAIHFDDGRDLQFAWPTDNLAHALLDVGQPVQLTATGDRGVVSSRLETGGRIFYSVGLADGGNRTVTEDGVRIAIELERLIEAHRCVGFVEETK